MGSALRSAEAWRADRLFSQGASAFHSPALERVTHAAAGSRALLPVRPTLGVGLLASTLGSPPAVASRSRPSPLISCHSRQDFSTPGREARRSEVKGWRAQTATCPSAAPPVTQPRGCRRTRAGAGGRSVGSQNFGTNIREPNPAPEGQRTKSLHWERLHTLAPLLRGTGSGRAPRRLGSRVIPSLPPASLACHPPTPRRPARRQVS